MPFQAQMKVCFSDIDNAGIVYYPRFVHYFHVALEDFFSMELGVDYSLTHSCYDPDPQGRSCGRCDSCRLRLKGFAEAGLEDPLPYLHRGL